MTVENLIETRYLAIFQLFYSKSSPQISINLIKRFKSDTNVCSSSFCGIASSARVVAVLMVEMSLTKNPFNFNFGDREKSHEAKSGEYGG